MMGEYQATAIRVLKPDLIGFQIYLGFEIHVYKVIKLSDVRCPRVGESLPESADHQAAVDLRSTAVYHLSRAENRVTMRTYGLPEGEVEGPYEALVFLPSGRSLNRIIREKAQKLQRIDPIERLSHFDPHLIERL